LNNDEKYSEGLEDFQLEKLLKQGKKPPVKKEELPKEAPVVDKLTIVKKVKSVKKKLPIFNYGSNKFKSVDDVSTFMLLNYKKREKHATKLLNDPQFIIWLKKMELQNLKED